MEYCGSSGVAPDRPVRFCAGTSRALSTEEISGGVPEAGGSGSSGSLAAKLWPHWTSTPRLMTKVNTKPLDEAVEQTIDQAIEQTCAEIACSQALSQAEADLVRSIKRLADDHDGSAHEP
jgi:hypothetical protein